MLALKVLVFALGVAIVLTTIASAVRTFVLPRSANDPFTRLVFTNSRRVFGLWLRGSPSYERRDRVMALYAPLTLVLLPAIWLAAVLLGYTAMFWALGIETLYDAFKVSGSSLLTLGFASVDGGVRTAFSFSEATIGLVLVALLISYLPTMYAAFSRREVAVTLLEVRAGSPPSAREMIERYHRIHGLSRLTEVWSQWEGWFADVEETHTSLAALPFFRSPVPARSWIVAAGAVLDTASLAASTLDIPHDPQADLCIRAGFLALRRITDFFGIPYRRDPRYPRDPISISRQEYDELYDRLASQGVPLKPDREQAWKDYAGWRVNYDDVLLVLCTLTMAPPAPWSSDRAPAPGSWSRRAHEALPGSVERKQT